MTDLSPVNRLGSSANIPIICFSHLRWNFVWQRPQHLMSRFGLERPIYFFEESAPTDDPAPHLDVQRVEGTAVRVVQPLVPRALPAKDREAAVSRLLDELLRTTGCASPALWFYTPMMWPLARHIDAAAVVYDCMDELANFRFAPAELRENEAALMQAADVVFTGGRALYEARRHRHDNIHAFASGVDVAHFEAARRGAAEPEDQACIPAPKLGYFGVIDERLDLELLRAVAAARPDWSLVMIGPVVKIDPADLPRLPNIHWMGQRPYAALPAYLAAWTAALMPFALNEATRFISPTKAPEYLAGGKPVISTPVQDVVASYAGIDAVGIAAGAPDFLAACERAMALARNAAPWLPAVDRMLGERSWDAIHARMAQLVKAAVGPSPLAVTPPACPSARRGAPAPYDAVVVGAGFAGSVLAERLAAGSGLRVLVCERRDHVAGNAHDHPDAAGILIHRYGPHIFHTNSAEVEAYLSRFTEWRPYEHRVLADLGDRRLPIPINRTTLNGLYGLDLASDAEAEAFLAAQAEPVETIRNSRDVVVSQVGTHLYETFFRGYTRKQWGLDPTELDKSVTARVPTRTSLDDRYFQDRFQAMPLQGYTRVFERMLDHEGIDLALGTDFADLGPEDRAPLTLYTGPIDAFFGYRFGALPYRCLRFEHRTLDQRRHQEVAVVNYPSEAVPYTRVTEYKHLTGQVHPMTSISYEYSSGEGDPFYPVPRAENQLLYKRYEALAQQRDDVVFLGRLGSYRYYNMDQVVGQALSVYRRLGPKLEQAALAAQRAFTRSSAVAARRGR